GSFVGSFVPNPKGEMKAVTTRSGLAYEGPSIPANSPLEKVVERDTEEITNKEHSNCQGSTAHMQPLVSIPKPDVLRTQPKPTTPYPSRLNDQKLRKKARIKWRSSFKSSMICTSTLAFCGLEADPRVPLILGRSFLRTDRALIDVYREEITLWVNDEAVTFSLNQTTRYSSTYDDLSVNRINIIDVARKEYAQEFLGFSNYSSGGNPTSTFEPILSDSSLSLTPLEGSDFILEEIDAYLKDESISPEIDHADCDLEGDICLIEKLLNHDPF
nr:reverse transcriptase domain-containing protein [Tanacetum cinerariifolium]